MEELKIRFGDKFELEYISDYKNYYRLYFQKDSGSYTIALDDRNNCVKIEAVDTFLIREFFSWICKSIKG